MRQLLQKKTFFFRECRPTWENRGRKKYEVCVQQLPVFSLSKARMKKKEKCKASLLPIVFSWSPTLFFPCNLHVCVVFFCLWCSWFDRIWWSDGFLEYYCLHVSQARTHIYTPELFVFTRMLQNGNKKILERIGDCYMQSVRVTHIRCWIQFSGFTCSRACFWSSPW